MKFNLIRGLYTHSILSLLWMKLISQTIFIYCSEKLNKMFWDTLVMLTFFQKLQSVICKDKSNEMQQRIKIFIIPYLYEAQHVSGDTPPVIRSLKLHWQPLVFYTWKVVGHAVGGRCQERCA